MIEKTALLKEMFDIQQEIGLSLEYETDARDVWPKRWNTLFKRIQDWPDMEIEAAIDATSDATEVDLEAAFGGTAEEIVI